MLHHEKPWGLCTCVTIWNKPKNMKSHGSFAHMEPYCDQMECCEEPWRLCTYMLHVVVTYGVSYMVMDSHAGFANTWQNGGLQASFWHHLLLILVKLGETWLCQLQQQSGSFGRLLAAAPYWVLWWPLEVLLVWWNIWLDVKPIWSSSVGSKVMGPLGGYSH